MLTPEEMKPHILHEDPWIRRAAIEYFGDSWSLDPDIPRLVLDAHERYYCGGQPDLVWLRNLPIDTATAARILGLLDSTTSDEVAESSMYCLGQLPLEVLKELPGCLKDHPRLSDEAKQRIHFRLALAKLSDEDLCEELLRFSGRPTMRIVPDHMSPLDAPLVEELASRKAPDDSSICAVLGARQFRGTYFDYLLMNVAGSRRLKAAVPLLLDRLLPNAEDIDIGGRASYVISRISDLDLVGKIQERWKWIDHCAAVDLLGQVRTPSSEEFLVECMEETADPDLLYWIANSLCGLFSAHALSPVRSLVGKRLILEEEEEELQKAVLPVIDLLGLDVSDAKAWRKARGGR